MLRELPAFAVLALTTRAPVQTCRPPFTPNERAEPMELSPAQFSTLLESDSAQWKGSVANSGITME